MWYLCIFSLFFCWKVFLFKNSDGEWQFQVRRTKRVLMCSISYYVLFIIYKNQPTWRFWSLQHITERSTFNFCHLKKIKQFLIFNILLLFITVLAKYWNNLISKNLRDKPKRSESKRFCYFKHSKMVGLIIDLNRISSFYLSILQQSIDIINIKVGQTLIKRGSGSNKSTRFEFELELLKIATRD